MIYRERERGEGERGEGERGEGEREREGEKRGAHTGSFSRRILWITSFLVLISYFIRSVTLLERALDVGRDRPSPTRAISLALFLYSV